MYTFKLLHFDKIGTRVPPLIESQFQEKLYPKISKKLKKAGYKPGRYLISLNRKIWQLNPNDYRAVNPRSVFEDYSIGVTGVIFREHPGSSHNNFENIHVITGSIYIYWDISKRCNIEEINKFIIDGDLTKLLLSPICKFGIFEIKLLPLLNEEQDNKQSSQSVMNEDFKFSYEINGEDYPDAIFYVRFIREVTQKQLKRLEAVLKAFVSKQQDLSGDDGEFISYIGEAEMSDDKCTAQIHIDFGNCEPEMIWQVLNELSEKIDGIAEVICI